MFDFGDNQTQVETSWKYLSNGVLHAPQKIKIAVAKQKRKSCSRLVIADQGGQKNRNGKLTVFLFCNIFY